MAFGRPKNRRRADAAKSADALAVKARSAGPVVAVLLGTALASVAAIALGFYGWRWAKGSQLFGAKQLAFHGLSRAKESELLRLGGLQVGTNLLALDRAAAERGMASHPWVKSVELTRRLPSAVSVTVTEYEPVALAALGDLYLVDEGGRPFKRLAPEDGVDLPLLTGLERDAYVLHASESAERLAKALEVAAAYQRSGAAKGAPLSEVRLSPDGWLLVTGAGQSVRLSADERAVGSVEAQLERLSQVRQELARRGLVAQVVHLDNRVRPGWVTVQVSPVPSERRGEARKSGAPSRE